MLVRCKRMMDTLCGVRGLMEEGEREGVGTTALFCWRCRTQGIEVFSKTQHCSGKALNYNTATPRSGVQPRQNYAAKRGIMMGCYHDLHTRGSHMSSGADSLKESLISTLSPFLISPHPIRRQCLSTLRLSAIFSPS